MEWSARPIVHRHFYSRGLEVKISTRSVITRDEACRVPSWASSGLLHCSFTEVEDTEEEEEELVKVIEYDEYSYKGAAYPRSSRGISSSTSSEVSIDASRCLCAFFSVLSHVNILYQCNLFYNQNKYIIYLMIKRLLCSYLQQSI